MSLAFILGWMADFKSGPNGAKLEKMKMVRWEIGRGGRSREPGWKGGNRSCWAQTDWNCGNWGIPGGPFLVVNIDYNPYFNFALQSIKINTCPLLSKSPWCPLGPPSNLKLRALFVPASIQSVLSLSQKPIQTNPRPLLINQSIMLWFRGSFTLYFPFAIFIQHIQGLSIQDSSKITKFYPFSQSSIQESIPNLSQIDDKSIELPLDSRSTFIDVSLGKKSPNFLMKQYG